MEKLGIWKVIGLPWCKGYTKLVKNQDIHLK